jgi:hypothetical protein
MHILKLLKKTKLKLFLKIKEKNIIYCKKLTSKIFYNLTYIYIKNNFLLINKLIQYNTISKIIFKNAYILNDLNIYNDLFILNYLDSNINNKAKTMIQVYKTKKPLSIILILKKILFSTKSFFRLLKNEKAFLKINIYNIFFILFYYYITNSLSYTSFLKFNNLKKKKSLFTLNIFLKKNLKQSFKFFFKNIIMFLYKFSLIKHKKKKFFTLLKKKKRNIYKKYHLSYTNRKKELRALKKRRIIIYNKKKLKLKKKLKSNFKLFKKYRRLLRKKKYKKEKEIYKEKRERLKSKKKKRNRLYERKRVFFLRRTNYNRAKERIKNKKLYEKLEQNFKLIKQNIKNKQNRKKKKLKNKKKLIKKVNQPVKKKNINLIKKIQYTKKIKQKLIKNFKLSIKKKNNFFLYKFKKLFFKKTLVKRIFELSFKKDIQLKNASTILKNNKKFKFLTFPVNSICKFFFKNSMYNIFMTLVIFPNNLTIGNYSGGHFNILSKRRDRGSINSLKSMSKVISLKIYQSNLSFIIFCPRLFTNNNKRLIKTIFYSFKILNRSPITKIYLYRPVIRNGIRSKKIPRK